MKKTTQKFSAVFVALFALVNSVNAQNTAPQLTKISDVNNQPVFQLKLNNNQKNTYTLVVKDLSGVVLHEEKITDAKAVRNFTLDSDAFSNASTLIFDVRNNSNNINTLFEVKNTTRVVNDVIVINVTNKKFR
jgi:hypothetical protein